MLTLDRLTIEERQLLIEAMRDHCAHLDAAARAARLKGFGLHVEQPFRRASKACKDLLAKLKGYHAAELVRTAARTAPAADVLSEALEYAADRFESADDEVSGADLVDWFAGWRERAQRALAVLEGRSHG